MSDLISRSVAIKAIEDLTDCYNGFSGSYDKSCVIGALQEVPSAERRGKWIERNPKNSETCRLIECSECEKSYIVPYNVPYADWTEAHKYCVNCGARMEE